MLEIKDVSKYFHHQLAVDELSLQVEKGKSFGLIGSNGAGKTTTFRMILGLIAPSSGTILWDGESIDYKNVHKIGYLPEERGLYPKIKIREQLIYLGKLKKMLHREAEREVDYWMDRLGVMEHRNKKAKELSKGNQQKVQFIYSVLHDPELLILDEPFSGLDPVNVEKLKEAVFDVRKKGTGVIFSSHRMEHIEEMCEDLCFLQNGKTVIKGTIKEIKKNYPTKKLILKSEKSLLFASCLLGVDRVEERNEETHIELTERRFAHSVLKQILSHGEIQKYELKEPTLHEIFLKEAGEEHE